MTANEFLTAGVASDKSPISYRNCLVATRTDDGRVVGAVNAVSAATIGSNGYRFVPRDRLDHIRPILRLQERDSLFLNALAVHESVRHQGVGTAFLSWARARARAGLLGMPRLPSRINAPSRKRVSDVVKQENVGEFVRSGSVAGKIAGVAEKNLPTAPLQQRSIRFRTVPPTKNETRRAADGAGSIAAKSAAATRRKNDARKPRRFRCGQHFKP